MTAVLSITAAIQHHRHKAMVGLMIALVGLGGCRASRPTFRSFLPNVPPVRWPSLVAEPPANIDEKSTEPSVAANVAIKKDSAADPDTDRSIVEGEVVPRSQFSKVSTRPLRTPPGAFDGSPWPDFADSHESNSSRGGDAERSDSPLDRLDAALSDDVLQAQTMPQLSVTIKEQRNRVEQLVRRAKELLSLGQLQLAKETAEMAQQVGDSAQLDYHPDEDRPVDLIRRIDGQIEASSSTQQGDESATENADKTEPGASKVSARSFLSPEQELRELIRKNRNWTTLFRLGRKTADSEQGPISQVSDEARLGQPSVLANPSGTNLTMSRAKENGAVVMANRSVSLRPSDTAVTRTATVISDADDLSLPGAVKLPVDLNPSVPAETSDLGLDQDTPFPIHTKSMHAAIESDERGPELPDFEAIEIPTRTRKWTSLPDEPVAVISVETDRTVHEVDWILAYGLIGVCTVFALICYRRGAT